MHRFHKKPVLVQPGSAGIDSERLIMTALEEILGSYATLNIGIACSGGLDSSVLLAATVAFRESICCKFPLNINALHINHHLRGERELDEEFAALISMCLRWNVPLFTHVLAAGSIMDIRAVSGRSIEEIARELRYAALDQFAQELDLDLILLAHHSRDQIEQTLIRFLQGISEHGGMALRRGRYVRPLLNLEPSVLQHYAHQNGLRWHEDSSNSESIFLRNRVRQKLLPVIESVFPGYQRALTMRSQRAAIDDDFLKSVADQIIWTGNTEMESGGGNPALQTSAGPFFKQHPAIRLRSLHSAALILFREHKIPKIPSYRFFEPILSIAQPSTDAILREAEGIQVLLRNGQLVIRAYIVAALKKGYLIHLKEPGCLMVPGFGNLIVKQTENGEAGLPLPIILRKVDSEDMMPGRGESVIAWLRSAGVPLGIVSEIPVMEIDSKIRGVLTGPWTGENILFGTEEDHSESGTNTYVLKLKELGFST